MADRNRKKTPDIMSDILGGSAPEPTIMPVDHNTGIPAYQPTIKPEKKRSAPKAKPAPEIQKEEAPGAKIKATFYISSAIVDKLEEGWTQLRRITPKEQRGDISKSFIVETALQEALEELDSRQTASLLVKKARQIKTDKK